MKNWMDEFVINTDLSQNRPLKDVVYESLRKTLIEYSIPVGERFIEKEYSQRLNISRTPVREALKLLEEEGLVEYVHRSGVIVSKITRQDVIEIYKLRESLEILIAEAAIENITREEIDYINKLLDATEKANNENNIDEVLKLFGMFNDHFYNASRMRRLPTLISSLNLYLQKFRNICINTQERRDKGIQQHRLIMKAVEDKDLERAKEIIKIHLQESILIVLDYI